MICKGFLVYSSTVVRYVEEFGSNGAQQAFDTLKLKLMTEPILALPTDEETYVLDVDASNFGLVAVLSQKQFGTERVIAYSSRTMRKPNKSMYDTTKEELLAVVSGLKQFPQYLTGRHFAIRTDHAALSWLRRTPEPMPQLARWLSLIEEFDYEVIHRDGKRHQNADGLSRRSESAATSKSPELSDAPESREEECVPNVNAVGQTAATELSEGRATPSVGKHLAEQQQADPELGPLIKLRLRSEQNPTITELSTESEVAKRMLNQWEQLEIRDGLVYRRAEGKPSEQAVLQLFVSRRIVQELIRTSLEGQTGGHFGIKCTLDQVR